MTEPAKKRSGAAVTNFWVDKAAKKKGKQKECKYRPLSKREEEAIDPHKVKGKKGGSKKDLAICGFGCPDAGAIVEHRKKQHYDKDGNIVKPKDIHYEPTGLNINDPEIQEQLKKPKEDRRTKVMVDLFVTGFKESPDAVLKALRIRDASDSWKKGDPRFEGSPMKHKENGFSLAINPEEKTFDEWVVALLKRLNPDRLRSACGKCEVELSIGAYIVDEVPSFHLSSKATELLAALGAEVDLDLYFLGEDGAEE